MSTIFKQVQFRVQSSMDRIVDVCYANVNANVSLKVRAHIHRDMETPIETMVDTMIVDQIWIIIHDQVSGYEK